MQPKRFEQVHRSILRRSHTERGTTLAGLIVAGGKSTRFGADKASAIIAGKPMLQWVASALAAECSPVVVVRAAGQVLPPVEISVPLIEVEDVYEAKGPLAGLVAGMRADSTATFFVASCDVPLVLPSLIRSLAEQLGAADIACPYVDGFLQPLLALYCAETCLPAFEYAIERDILKITAAFGPLNVVVVREESLREADPDLRSFTNVNRAGSIAEIEALIQS